MSATRSPLRKPAHPTKRKSVRRAGHEVRGKRRKALRTKSHAAENNQAELSTNTASGIATRSSALASEVTIERCTFMNNTNSIAFTSGVVRSTIIVGDRGQICGATFTISCSNLFSNPGGDAVCATDGGGNFSADPQFCAADPAGSRNFELQADSPCAPGHHPTAVDCGQIGAAPVGCGVVDVEPSTWSAFKNLFR